MESIPWCWYKVLKSWQENCLYPRHIPAEQKTGLLLALRATVYTLHSKCRVVALLFSLIFSWSFFLSLPLPSTHHSSLSPSPLSPSPHLSLSLCSALFYLWNVTLNWFFYCKSVIFILLPQWYIMILLTQKCIIFLLLLFEISQ